MKKVLFSANDAFAIVNFRGNLVKELVDKDYDVVCTGELDGYEKDIENIGAEFVEFNIDKKGRNPFKEFLLIFKYIKHYRAINPDLILQFTIKPNLYGTLAARYLRIPVINNITGLGIVFNEKSFRRKIVEFLYKISTKHPKVIFFQNKEDLKLFRDTKLVKNKNYDLLPGSGINLDDFKPYEKANKKTIDFLFVGRLIKEKGTELFIEAAKNIKEKYPYARFHVCGLLTLDSNLNQEMFKEYQEKDYFSYHGVVKDIKSLHKFTDCLVLPTYYREGVPRSLIEASSSGIPIITTDNVGCRDIVEDKYNGYLIQKNDYESLYYAIESFLNMTIEEKDEMGKNGRLKTENEFDERIVIDKYIKYINDCFKTQLEGKI
jgi:galacturonosyltransferase